MAITKIGTPELFDFSATNTALQLPTGDTASRPSAPSAGEWRFNSELKYVEFWDGGAWRQIDTDAPAKPDDFPSQNFNVNTYFGTRATQTIDAKFNEAANFDGASSYIQLPNDSFSYTTMTFSAWVNPSVDDAYSYIFQNGLYDNRISGTIGWYVRRESGGSLLARGFSANSLSVAEFDVTSASSIIPLNTWTNVVCVLTPTSFNIYINGSSTAVASATFSNAITYSASQPAVVYLGASYYYSNGGNYEAYWDGAIDQVRIFNTALTSAQVEDLYTDETTTTAATLNFPAGAGCIAAYQLDGDASDVGGTYGGVETDIGYTGLRFQPDLVWIKWITGPAGGEQTLFDSIRGVGNFINSNLTTQQRTNNTTLTAFDTDGFTLGTDTIGYVNYNIGNPYVAWCWKAGGAPTATNSAGAGNVPTSGSVMIDGVASTAALAGTTAATKISANTKAGFSIVQFPATATSIQVAHGLTSAPDLIIWKNLSTADNWYVYQKDYSSPNAQYLSLNTDGSVVSNATNNFSSVTTTTFNSFFWGGASSNDIISYCFHNIANYQKTGAYLGTNAPGNIISTEITSGDGGFEPALVMIKNLTGSNSNWIIFDNKRNSANPRTDVLKWDTNGSETTEAALDVTFTTNGFVLNGAAGAAGTGQINSSGETYIYLAIAADKDSSVPTQANSFSTTLYTGNGATQNIYTPFAPDFTWLKERSGTQWNSLYDSIRGVGNRIVSNSVNAQNNDPNRLTSFNPNGFSIGTDGDTNTSNDTYVSWNWKAGGLPTINSDGTIPSIVSANQNAGFSIASYKGNGTQNATIGHGLTSPKLIIVKNTSQADSWFVGSTLLAANNSMELNSTAQAGSAAAFNYEITSTAFKTTSSSPTSMINANGENYIMYSFADKAGYQKVGTYAGTGASGNIVSTGFEPSWLMTKRSDTGNGPWMIFDNKRNPSNPRNTRLGADLTAGDASFSVFNIDFNSTSFTLNGTDADINGSGTYIYLAIA